MAVSAESVWSWRKRFSDSAYACVCVCVYRHICWDPCGNVYVDATSVNCLSAYLALSRAASLPAGEFIERKFEFRVRHPYNGDRDEIKKATTHRFTALKNAHNWGYHTLIEADKVEQYIDAEGYFTLEVKVEKLN